jgi:hypothetical protein
MEHNKTRIIRTKTASEEELPINTLHGDIIYELKYPALLGIQDKVKEFE